MLDAVEHYAARPSPSSEAKPWPSWNQSGQAKEYTFGIGFMTDVNEPSNTDHRPKNDQLMP